MFGILGLGFLLGMQHALEADHIAAVSSIAARRSNVADIVKHGLTWGLGHTVTLFVFAGAALALGHAIPENLSCPLETAVGIMLMGLGGHVLWRLWHDRVHVHRHSHGDGTVHIHVHSHARDTSPHGLAPHAHTHGFRWRTLVIGLMHGMAGSAALLVLAEPMAFRSRFEDGKRKLVPQGEHVETNDLGQYRLFGLQPGTYFVRTCVAPRVPFSRA